MADKKSFKADLNPAMQFITPPTTEQGESPFANVKPKPGIGFPPMPLQQTQATTQGKPPAGFKNNPLYIETKSRRLQLLVQPSLHTKLKDRATKEGKSINELVHSILEGALGEE